MYSVPWPTRHTPYSRFDFSNRLTQYYLFPTLASTACYHMLTALACDSDDPVGQHLETNRGGSFYYFRVIFFSCQRNGTDPQHAETLETPTCFSTFLFLSLSYGVL